MSASVDPSLVRLLVIPASITGLWLLDRVWGDWSRTPTWKRGGSILAHALAVLLVAGLAWAVWWDSGTSWNGD